MRKITLLTTATLLSIACIGGQSLTTEASFGRNLSSVRCGNKIIISGSSLDCLGNQNNTNEGNCDINSIFNQLMQNLPSQFPCPPAQTPDCNVPDNNTPDVELPDSDIPETDIPDVELPDANVPGTGTPDVELPDNNVPETETPDINTPEDNENLSYIEQVVNLVNIERAKEGLAPLTIDKNVQAAAQVRAVECEQSFSHTRPNGSGFSTALTEQGVSYRRAGENIAWGQRSPQEVVNAWMNSSGHRANIMNESFTKIGVGYYQNASGVKYWSQLFIG